MIIPYRPQCRGRLVGLWRDSFALGVGAPVPNPDADRRQFLDEHVRTPTSVQLALHDGELVGFCAFTTESVLQLYVHLDHLGQGIGTQLPDLAKANSGGKLWLYTFVTNAPARRFHARHGFDGVARGFEPVMQLGALRHQWRRTPRLASTDALAPPARCRRAGLHDRPGAPYDVGHLLAGHVFSWQNPVACGVGVLAGIGLDRLTLRTTPACPPISPR